MNNDEEKKKLFERIRAFFASLRDALRKRAQERRDGKFTPAVFERELKKVEQKLDELEEQDAVNIDCLRDVAETLEKITGVIEGGDLKNATPEEVHQHLQKAERQLENAKARGAEPFTVKAERIDDVMLKAFGVKTEELYIEQDGKKVLSPNVKFGLQKKEDGKADVFMIIDNGKDTPRAMRLNVSKEDDGQEKKEKVVFEKIPVFRSANGEGKYTVYDSVTNLEMMSLDAPLSKDDPQALREKSLNEIIGNAFFKASYEYTQARIAKGEKIAQQWSEISGTMELPYEKDEYHCVHDREKGYLIRDRHAKSVLAIKYDKDTKSCIATYYPNVESGFDIKPEDGIEVLNVHKFQQGGKHHLEYSVSTSPAADKILDTEMAQTALHLIIPDSFDFEKLNNVRHGNQKEEWDNTGGAHVKGAGQEKVAALRNEIESQLRSKKGLDDYFVEMHHVRHGKESQIIISAPDKVGKPKYVINFDKEGNVKTHLWSAIDLATGKRTKPQPVIKSGKNRINKVLDEAAFSTPELCVCYQVIKESMSAVAENLKINDKALFERQDSAVESKLYENEVIERAAEMAKEAIIATNMKGQIVNDHQFINRILDAWELHTKEYPDASVREILENNMEKLYYEMSQKGILEDAFSKVVAREYAGEKDAFIPERFESVGYSNEEDKRRAAAEFVSAEEGMSSDFGSSTLPFDVSDLPEGTTVEQALRDMQAANQHDDGYEPPSAEEQANAELVLASVKNEDGTTQGDVRRRNDGTYHYVDSRNDGMDSFEFENEEKVKTYLRNVAGREDVVITPDGRTLADLPSPFKNYGEPAQPVQDTVTTPEPITDAKPPVQDAPEVKVLANIGEDAVTRHEDGTYHYVDNTNGGADSYEFGNEEEVKAYLRSIAGKDGIEITAEGKQLANIAGERQYAPAPPEPIQDAPIHSEPVQIPDPIPFAKMPDGSETITRIEDSTFLIHTEDGFAIVEGANQPAPIGQNAAYRYLLEAQENGTFINMTPEVKTFMALHEKLEAEKAEQIADEVKPQGRTMTDDLEQRIANTAAEAIHEDAPAPEISAPTREITLQDKVRELIEAAKHEGRTVLYLAVSSKITDVNGKGEAEWRLVEAPQPRKADCIMIDGTCYPNPEKYNLGEVMADTRYAALTHAFDLPNVNITGNTSHSISDIKAFPKVTEVGNTAFRIFKIDERGTVETSTDAAEKIVTAAKLEQAEPQNDFVLAKDKQPHELSAGMKAYMGVGDLGKTDYITISRMPMSQTLELKRGSSRAQAALLAVHADSTQFKVVPNPQYRQGSVDLSKPISYEDAKQVLGEAFELPKWDGKARIQDIEPATISTDDSTSKLYIQNKGKVSVVLEHTKGYTEYKADGTQRTHNAPVTDAKKPAPAKPKQQGYDT